MIKIRDSCAWLDVYFPRWWVKHYWIHLRADWERICGARNWYSGEKNPEWLHPCYPNSLPSRHVHDHRCQSSKLFLTHLACLLPTIWCVSYSEFVFWVFISYTLENDPPWLPNPFSFIKTSPCLHLLCVMLAHYSAADSVFWLWSVKFSPTLLLLASLGSSTLL